MGTLGKDYLDLYRPLTHTKVQFGESRYWIEHNKQEIPYGTILTAILNYDAQPYLEAVQQLKDSVEARNDNEVLSALEEVRDMFLQLPLYNAYLGGMGMLDVYLGMPQFIDDIYNELQFLEPLYLAAEDIPAIQNRYTWFLSQALDDGGQRRKKGQRKIPLADRIRMNWMDAYVSGVSLGANCRVDAPNVQMQYAVLETSDGAEIVEKLYFDRLSDFVYIELMKGLQKRDSIPSAAPTAASGSSRSRAWTSVTAPIPLRRIPQSSAGTSAPAVASGRRFRTTKSGPSTSGHIGNTMPVS